MRLFTLVLAGIAAVLAAVVCLARPSAAAPSAEALEARLLAPCCFGGTLDVHDSEIARDLRAEIRTRVAAGEPTARIEADLIDRYGPQIRAMPHPGAWFATIVAVASAILFGAALLARRVRLWTLAGPAPARIHEVSRDAYDDRLDAELEAME